MKKLFKPFALLFASAALLSACSSDEPAGNSVPENVKGMDAYLRVNIQDAGDMMTRDGDPTDGNLTTGDEDPNKNVNNGDYEFGNVDENTVVSAKFYFYTADKVFSQEGTLTQFKPTGSISDNIEVFGQNVLVLKNLTTNTTPKYMVTVLNAPADFKPGATLDDTRAALSAIRNNDNKKTFVMSTTSFVDASFTDQYGTNMLEPSNFNVQPAGTVTPDDVFDKDTENKLKVVEVYVERLAAKVEVRSVVATDENGCVELTVPVAGDPNSQGGAQATTTKLYVKLSKWGLTSTAKNSYMIKNIAGLDGSSSDTFTVWNAPERKRSFWGKSWLWGKDVDTENANFTSYDDATAEFNKSFAYCAENTNELGKIAEGSGTKNRNLTSVLFTAQVFEKDEADNLVALDMVRYNGSLYKTVWFKDFVLNYLNINGKHNYYKQVVNEGETEYVQLNAKELGLDLAFVPTAEEGQFGNSPVKVVSTLKTFTGFWVKEGEGYRESSDADLTTLNADLAAFDNKDGKAVTVEAYKDGKMFYDIPIEHLVKEREAETNNIVVGNYGVVRNHWYLLTVDTIKRLGSGVFDPSKDIITEEDPKQPTYFLGAKINILSWKIVTQKVEL